MQTVFKMQQLYAKLRQEKTSTSPKPLKTQSLNLSSLPQLVQEATHTDGRNKYNMKTLKDDTHTDTLYWIA